MWMFYFLFWSAVRANEEPLYRKIGENVVLTSESVENPITNIRWKHGDNIAMQWNGDEIYPYKQFKDRGSLDILTGVMTITGLTRNDSGIYTVEINGKETNSQTELQVISPVPKPSLSVSCVPEMTYCVFTCSGSITEPAPVTYWWTAGEKRWNSTNQHKITKEEKERWFSCIVENPVSSNISEELFNPFITYHTWIEIMPIVVGVILFVCIIIIIYLIWKRRKERAANKTPKENEPMVSSVQESSNQQQISGVAQSTDNRDAVISTPYEDLETDGSPNTSDEPANKTDLKPQWQYERRRGGWRDFSKKTDPPNECSVTSDDIEKWYQEKTQIKRFFTVNEDEYELDFTVFTEQSHADPTTSNVRKVRCVMVDHECNYIAVPATVDSQL